MRLYEAEVYAMLDAFYRSTGIGAICFDPQGNLYTRAASPVSLPNPSALFQSGIADFLREVFGRLKTGMDSGNDFYTLVLPYAFISNVVPIMENGFCIGAAVTEPVPTRKMKSNEADMLLNEANLTGKNRKLVKEKLLGIPVVPYERMTALGKILFGLTRTFLPGHCPQQALKRLKPSMTETDGKHKNENFQENPNYLSYSTFLLIKETIKTGNTRLLLETMDRIGAHSVPTDQLNRADFIRSVKDNFIRSCALGCFAAIEGNAPYDRMMSLSDSFIRKAESFDNIYDIYELTKTAMIGFSRSVSSSGTIYSRPVRKSLQYIEKHYAEKITLRHLADHTKLSIYYLSGLIRKETGFSLTENINKIRIERSKQLLSNLNMSILDVAQSVGFPYQNYFAAVFKKFTGKTPTDYRRNLGAMREETNNPLSSESQFRAIYEQVIKLLRTFPGMYDTVRIVDPVKHLAWVVNENLPISLPDICYTPWKRGEPCKNCISKNAYILGETLFKLEGQKNNLYLVLATPKTIGKKVFVIEILKKVLSEPACPVFKPFLVESEISEESGGLKTTPPSR